MNVGMLVDILTAIQAVNVTQQFKICGICNTIGIALLNASNMQGSV